MDLLRFLQLFDGEPAAGSAGGIRVYAKKLAGRLMMAFRNDVGAPYMVQPFLGQNRICMALAQGGSTSIQAIGMGIQTTGTATAATIDNTGLYASMKRVDILVTAAATTAVAGFRHNDNQYWRGNAAGLGGFTFVCRFGISTGTSNSTRRAYVGFRSGTGAPTDVDPSTLSNVLGFGYDSGDSSWQFMHRTGSGTVAKESLGVSFGRPTADNTSMYEAAMFCEPNGSTVYYTFKNLTSGASISGSVTTDIPASGTMLSMLGYTSVGGTSAVTGISFCSLYTETDY